MLTNPELSQDYPPARNQLGPSAWGQMRCVAAFDAATAGVRAAAQGPITTSEQTLAWAWDIFAQSAVGPSTSEIAILGSSPSSRRPLTIKRACWSA